MKKIILTIIISGLIFFSSYAQYLPDTLIFCNPTNTFLSLVDGPDYDTINIFWTYPNNNISTGGTEIEIIEGGMYKVEGTLQNGTPIEDSCFAIYRRCEPFEFKVSANGQELYAFDTVTICADSIITFQIDYFQTNPNPCYIPDIYFSFLYFDDSLYAFYDSDAFFDAKIRIGGTYLVEVVSFDSRTCEQTYYYYIKIMPPPKFEVPDTLFFLEDKRLLTADTTNAFVKIFPQRYVLEHEFSDKTIFASGNLADDSIVYNLTVNAPPNAYVHNLDDITLTLSISAGFGEYLRMQMYAPDGSSSVLISPIGLMNQYIVGEPVLDYTDINNIFMSAPVWFKFKYGNYNIYPGNNVSYIGADYLDPAGDLYQIEFTEILSSEYTFTASDLLGTSINGTWTISLSSNEQFSTGTLGPITLKFPKYDFIKQSYPKVTWIIDNIPIEEQSTEITTDNSSLYVLVSNDACTVEKEITLVKPETSLSNTITPNGDGINDYWIVSKTFPIGSYVKIFDNRGRMLGKFATEQYPQGWDGSLNGKILASGSYYFIAYLPDGSTYKGIINIITQN